MNQHALRIWRRVSKPTEFPGDATTQKLQDLGSGKELSERLAAIDAREAEVKLPTLEP